LQSFTEDSCRAADFMFINRYNRKRKRKINFFIKITVKAAKNSNNHEINCYLVLFVKNVAATIHPKG